MVMLNMGRKKMFVEVHKQMREEKRCWCAAENEDEKNLERVMMLLEHELEDRW